MPFFGSPYKNIKSGVHSIHHIKWCGKFKSVTYLKCFLVLLFSSTGVKVETCDSQIYTFPSPTFEQLTACNFPWFYVQLSQSYPKYLKIIFDTFMFPQFSIHKHSLGNWGFCHNSSGQFLVPEHAVNSRAIWKCIVQLLLKKVQDQGSLSHISSKHKHLKWNVNLWMRSQ
jgi:hypothetical protein